MLITMSEGVPVGLVDTASAKVGAPAVPANMHGAWLIRNVGDRGFGMACNEAEEAAFPLFLNPDALEARLASPLAWRSMRKRAKQRAFRKSVLAGAAG